MTKIAEIHDRAACAVWCPLQSRSELVALGTKDSVGIGFEDTGGILEVYDLKLSDNGGATGDESNRNSNPVKKPLLLGSLATASRFASVAWSTYTGEGKYPLGLLAGGMTDGLVHFWNVAAIIPQSSSNDSHSKSKTDTDHAAASLVATVKKHTPGPVAALEFNPFLPHQLATGGSNGQVYIIDLSMAEPNNQNSDLEVLVTEPATGHKQAAEITGVAWNSQVAHILASSSGDGSVAVWDLKSRKAWCEIRAEHTGQAVADVRWNPTLGLHLLTASADHRNPHMKVWDLGASTSMPLATLQGHQGGLLRTHWCPHDDSLLLTCARDNRTFLWDLHTLAAVAEIPSEASAESQQLQQQQQQQQAQTPNALFGSSTLAEQKYMRYDVKWSPWKRGLALTCSLDRKVQIHAVGSLSIGRPPKWMRPGSVVATAFGGTVVSVGTLDRVVTIRVVPEQPALARTAAAFERQIMADASTGTGEDDPSLQQHQQMTDMSTRSQRSSRSTKAAARNALVQPSTVAVMAFCEEQLAKAKPGSVMADIWGFMRLLFSQNNRQALTEHLGFSAAEVAELTAAAAKGGSVRDHDDAEELIAATAQEDEESQHNDVAALIEAHGVDALSLDDVGVSHKIKKTAPRTMSRRAEETVKKALLVGNLEAAVECCFQAGNFSDALILASFAGAEFWAQTQERYFASEAPKRPYLSMVSAILRRQFREYVAQANPKQWKETLAILSTYSTSDEFHSLCMALGDRLEEAGDSRIASLCYMVSLNLQASVKFWKAQLEQTMSLKPGEEMSLLALHDFVVKVTVYLSAVGYSTELPADVADLFATYSEAVAEQGLFAIAAKYCRQGDSERIKQLRDRLYRSRASAACFAILGQAPEFPYQMVAVEVSRGTVYAAETRAKAEAQALAAQQRQHQLELQQEQLKLQQEQRLQQEQQQQQSQAYGYDGAAYGQQQEASYAAYGQQGQAAYANAYATQQPPGAVPAQDVLAPGWIALQDPSSGMTYYANQSTGATQWEKPVVAAAPTPVSSIPSTVQAQNLDASIHSTVSQTTNTSQYNGAGGSTKATLVSKYGDGFVTSASHPELAYQYGNVGTSNPYSGVNRPGTAARAAGAQQQQQAPISGTLNFDNLEMPQELVPMRDELLNVVSMLQQCDLSVADKRQLVEGEKGVAILIKKLVRGGVGEEAMMSVSPMITALAQRDYPAATHYQKYLVTIEWKEHKDWLKGLGVLIQLASKKLWP